MITKFWPLSVLQNSPLMPQHYAYEVSQFYHQALSRGAYYACVDVARRTQPLETSNLAVIESVGAPSRRAYWRYPDYDEWLRLERTVMCETDDGFMFLLMDALH